MRVVDWQKWQRAKAIGAAISALIAVACAGGLEGDATTPIPSVAGFVFFIAVAISFAVSFAKHDNQH